MAIALRRARAATSRVSASRAAGNDPVAPSFAGYPAKCWRPPGRPYASPSARYGSPPGAGQRHLMRGIAFFQRSENSNPFQRLHAHRPLIRPAANLLAARSRSFYGVHIEENTSPPPWFTGEVGVVPLAGPRREGVFELRQREALHKDPLPGLTARPLPVGEVTEEGRLWQLLIERC